MIAAVITQGVVLVSLLAALLVSQRAARDTAAGYLELQAARDREHAATLEVRDNIHAAERAELLAVARAERSALMENFEAERAELLTRIQRPEVFLPPPSLQGDDELHAPEDDDFDKVGTIVRVVGDDTDLVEGAP